MYILGCSKEQFYGDHALQIEQNMISRSKYGLKCLKNAENAKNRRIQPKYRAHDFENSFIALPVPENPMLEKRILKLSPIGKKLGGPPTSFGRHLGFSKLRETPTLRKKLPPLFFKSTSWWTRISNKKTSTWKPYRNMLLHPTILIPNDCDKRPTM